MLITPLLIYSTYLSFEDQSQLPIHWVHQSEQGSTSAAVSLWPQKLGMAARNSVEDGVGGPASKVRESVAFSRDRPNPLSVGPRTLFIQHYRMFSRPIN